VALTASGATISAARAAARPPARAQARARPQDGVHRPRAAHAELGGSNRADARQASHPEHRAKCCATYAGFNGYCTGFAAVTAAILEKRPAHAPATAWAARRPAGRAAIGWLL